MKRTLSILLSAVLLLSVTVGFGGCSDNSVAEPTASATQTAENKAEYTYKEFRNKLIAFLNKRQFNDFLYQ